MMLIEDSEKNSIDIVQLVELFNALPRTEKMPTGKISNEWHFDIRYIQLEPNPCHVVALLQPQSQIFHVQRLPLGLPSDKSGIEFFPESGKQAASQLAQGLIYSFVNGVAQEDARAPSKYGPWRLTTEDRTVAIAVGEEFRRLGVSGKEIPRIGISSKATTRIADSAFDKYFSVVKRAAGFTGNSAASIVTPQPIMFYNFKLDPPLPHIPAPGTLAEFDVPLQYLQMRANARPATSAKTDSKKMIVDMGQEMQILQRELRAKPPSAVKAAADRGDPKAALDYGLRLSVGLGVESNRTLSRDYVIKAALSDLASDTVKATAHSAMIDWYIQSCKSDFRSRYMFAACHHANAAAALCRRVSAPGTPASPAVLWFMSKMFEVHAKSQPSLLLFFKDAIRAMDERTAQMNNGREKMTKKRLMHPNRYRCAAVGCGVEADTGKMLSRCSGACDADKKPSYCSKECQKSDWKNHKPFCMPGAECSVIDDGSGLASGTEAGSSRSGTGAIQVPITHSDGSRVVVSSSTIDSKMLKEIRDYAESKNVPAGLLSALSIERAEL